MWGRACRGLTTIPLSPLNQIISLRGVDLVLLFSHRNSSRSSQPFHINIGPPGGMLSSWDGHVRSHQFHGSTGSSFTAVPVQFQGSTRSSSVQFQDSAHVQSFSRRNSRRGSYFS
jgi:hypothetical protein